MAANIDDFSCFRYLAEPAVCRNVDRLQIRRVVEQIFREEATQNLCGGERIFDLPVVCNRLQIALEIAIRDFIVLLNFRANPLDHVARGPLVVRQAAARVVEFLQIGQLVDALHVGEEHEDDGEGVETRGIVGKALFVPVF